MNVGQYTILLVEDEDNDALLIERAFRKANLANPIFVVRDGEDAVAYLSGHGQYADRDNYPLPVLILQDLKLPKMSGMEVMAWLRQQPRLKELPVVVLTSSKESLDVNRAYDLGANSYLVKPITFDSVVEMMKTLDLYWLIINDQPRGPGAE